MNTPDHISESLKTIVRVKILKFFKFKFGFGMEKIRIRDKHPRSATQNISFLLSHTINELILVVTTWQRIFFNGNGSAPKRCRFIKQIYSVLYKQYCDPDLVGSTTFGRRIRIRKISFRIRAAPNSKRTFEIKLIWQAEKIAQFKKEELLFFQKKISLKR
jgi:hypothetical protein